MSLNLVYPTSAEMEQIAQDLLPKLQADRPIFNHLPMRTVDEFMLIWEQLDNFEGLQQIRGMNGAPGKVAQVGANQFSVMPGVYGEFKVIDERMLTTRRQWGTFGNPVNITDLVMEAETHLLQRRLDRIELIGWNILQGTYSVAGPNGAVMATDSYTVQTFTATNEWSSTSDATPFADFMSVKLKHRGHSVSFGPGAFAYMNLETFNNLLQNANSDDLAGRRIPENGAAVTINNVQDVNQILNADGLPSIAVYDEGYVSDGSDGNAAGTFVTFIPNDKVIVVGKRPAGQLIGEYRMTRNINNPDMAPGAYTRVIVEDNHIPPKVEVHDGHNGGPVIFYPSAIVVMSV